MARAYTFRPFHGHDAIHGSREWATSLNEWASLFSEDGYEGEINVGTVGVGGVIASYNYDPGVAGWSINGDGDAEFDDVIVRGEVSGTVPALGTFASPNFDAGVAGWSINGDGNAEFNNIVARGMIAGEVISGETFASPNYAAGVTGWSVSAAGDAEFNNVTIRGTLDGVDGSFSGTLDAVDGDFSGTVTTGGSIQSPNYVAGTTGWTINAAGDAEFNDVTIRGTLDGATGTFAGEVSGSLFSAENADFKNLDIGAAYAAGGVYPSAVGITFHTSGAGPTGILVWGDLGGGLSGFEFNDDVHALDVHVTDLWLGGNLVQVGAAGTGPNGTTDRQLYLL